MAAQLRVGQKREGITSTKVARLVLRYNKVEESKHQVGSGNATSYISRKIGKRHGESLVAVRVALFNKLSLETNTNCNSTKCIRLAGAGNDARGSFQSQSSGEPARSCIEDSDHRACENKTGKHTGNLPKGSAEKDTSLIVTDDTGKTRTRLTGQPVENSASQHKENAANLSGEGEVSQFVESAASKPVDKMASQQVENAASQQAKREPVPSLVLDYIIKKLGPVAVRGINWMLDSNHPFYLANRPIVTIWRSLRYAMSWLPAEPLWRSLQTSHVAAAGECPTCSPLSRLSVLHYNQSGSSIEGLDDLGDDPKRDCTSDIDIMIELAPCRWIEAEGAGDQPKSTDPVPDGRAPPLLMAMPSENPGFVLLFVEPTTECEHGEKRQFSAAAVRHLVQDWCRVRHSPDVIIETPGPAVNVSLRGARDGGTDWVPCLRLPVWPGEEEFRSRQRVTDFPPAEVREDIVRFGVHLVPTGHQDSRNELIEFRLSFSRAELVAGWHLFATVRVAVQGLKNVKNVMKKRRKKTTDTQTGKQLKSYHIKTAALWLCQDTPREQWAGPIKAMHMILDRLEEAIKTGTLLCFFWTEINLLAGFSEKDLLAMGRQIVKMRKSMLLHLLAWFSTAFDMKSWLEKDMNELLQMAPENRQQHTGSVQKPTGMRNQSSTESQQPSSESQQPSSESQQSSSESQQPSSESQQPSSESQQPSSESQQPSSESQQPPSESQQPPSESQQPSSESQQPSTESQQPSSESQQPSTESQQPPSKSRQPPSEREQPPSESRQQSSESQQPPPESQQPSSESQQPSSESQQSSSESQQPSSESQQPSFESQQPSTESQQPSSESQQPSSEDQQPSSESQQPSSESHQPSSESQQPSSESQQLESSIRQLRCFMARRLTIWAVQQGLTVVRPVAGGSVGQLLRRSADAELEYYSHTTLMANEVHRILLQAMLVAPDDLVGNARLTSHGGDVYSWDVAPLLALLTDSDMRLLLGDPEAVAEWWSQQLRLPSEERPEGLTAELNTPRGRVELLLHPDLMVRAFEETRGKSFFEKHPGGSWWSLSSYQQVREELEDDLRCDMESRLRRSPNLSEPMIASAARNWKLAIRRLLSGEELRSKHDALMSTLPDRWQLRQFAIGDNH